MIVDHIRHNLFGKMTFEKLVIKPPHRNTNLMNNEACFFYIVEGTSDTFSANDSVELNASQSVLMKCGSYISKVRKTSEKDIFQAIMIHFYPEVLKKIYSDGLPELLIENKIAENRNLQHGLVENNFLLERYIQSLLFYFDNPALISEELLVLKFKELILLLLRTDQSKALQQVFSGLFSPTSFSFKQIIDEHLYSDLALEDLAHLTNLSLSTFKREFKKNYNASPAAYLRTKKLERAVELLTVSNERLADISALCGFNNQSLFSKLFQKYFQQTPSSFRLNQKNKSLTQIKK